MEVPRTEPARGRTGIDTYRARACHGVMRLTRVFAAAFARMTCTRGGGTFSGYLTSSPTEICFPTVRLHGAEGRYDVVAGGDFFVRRWWSGAAHRHDGHDANAGMTRQRGRGRDRSCARVDTVCRCAGRGLRIEAASPQPEVGVLPRDRADRARVVVGVEEGAVDAPDGEPHPAARRSVPAAPPTV